MNAKHILIALAIAVFLYSAFKQADAVQSIEFQGEYVEANTTVHSALIEDGDTFKIYGYAEIQSEEQMRDPSGMIAKPAIAEVLERTIRRLPPPPRSIQTWF